MISNIQPGVLFRFLATGALNTLFGVAMYWLFLYIGLSYQWASALSLVLGILFSFNSHRALVFRTSGRFVRYVLVWALVYVVNIAFIAATRDYVGDYIAGVILLPVNIVLSFVLMRRFVFQEVKEQGAQ